MVASSAPSICTATGWLVHALAAGSGVLDVACGEGYGYDLLARVANSVTGVDVSTETIEHAIARYWRPQVRFVQGDCAALPCDDASFELVVSFETIEHHDRHMAMMRVLRPGGVVMISSPNRPEYDCTLTEPSPYHAALSPRFDAGGRFFEVPQTVMGVLRDNFVFCTK